MSEELTTRVINAYVAPSMSRPGMVVACATVRKDNGEDYVLRELFQNFDTIEAIASGLCASFSSQGIGLDLDEMCKALKKGIIDYIITARTLTNCTDQAIEEP